MFHLILMLCSTGVPACSTYDPQKSFPTETACKAEGTDQTIAHTYLKDGDGGVRVDGFICIKP